MKNKDILPQWFWENNHPAIIKREQWAQAQEILAAGKWGKRGKALSTIKKKFTLAKVKSGVLCGYFLLDMDWTQEEREQFINIINSINELDDDQDRRS